MSISFTDLAVGVSFKELYRKKFFIDVFSG
jgi:hypothetical protein